MGLRTYQVRGGSRRPAASQAELFDQNIDIGEGVRFPGGEYNIGTLYPREMTALEMTKESQIDIDGSLVGDVEAEYDDRSIKNLGTPQPPPTGANMPDAVSMDLDGVDYPEDPKSSNAGKYLKAGAAGIDTIGGIINAQAKYTNYVSSNNMKIYQAQLQQNYIRAEAARASLRQGNLAADRKGQALLNAVAQGQSATGDLAQTAMSNEDVYAAQNVMNIEINAMRSIYGMEREIATLNSNSRLARLERNQSIANSIMGGATSAASAMAGV